MKYYLFSILIVITTNHLIGAEHVGIDPECSGIMARIIVDKGVENGSIINSEARDRYNYLIENYKEQIFDILKVMLKPDDGLEARDGGLYNISTEHLFYFKSMNKWKKNGKSEDHQGLKMKSFK